MKRYGFFAVVFLLCTAMAGCDYKYGSDSVNPDDLPQVTLKRIKVGEDNMTFSIEIRNSSKAAYICLNPAVEPPDVAGILNYGVKVAASGKYTRTLTDLESNTDYVLYAGSTDGKTYSKVVSFEFKTAAKLNSSIVLTAGEASATRLVFDAAVYNADRAAYICRRTEDTAPGADLILAEGAPLSVGGQSVSYTVTGLQPSTDYTIYAVASRAGNSGTVRRLEMATIAD